MKFLQVESLVVASAALRPKMGLRMIGRMSVASEIGRGHRWRRRRAHDTTLPHGITANRALRLGALTCQSHCQAARI